METKKATAKLYNLKSYVEGKIMELNEGLATPEGVAEGLALVVARFAEELKPSD